MSPIQAPVCTPSAAAREDLTVPSWGPEFPHLNAFRDFTSLEEGNHATRKRLGSVAQFTLQTYQAAAVVVRTTHSWFRVNPVITPTPFFLPRCTVYRTFRSGIATISLLQDISRLYAAANDALAPVSPHSHLRCPDLQRQRYHQLPCPHEEFWNRFWVH